MPLKLLYQADKTELDKLIIKMTTSIKETIADHNRGQDSVISSKLGTKLLKALKVIETEITTDLVYKYKKPTPVKPVLKNADGEILHTYDEWTNKGYIIMKGSKANQRDENNKPLFSEYQVLAHKHQQANWKYN